MFHALRIERDVEIPTRDGSVLSANVFRPDADGRYPVIMTLGPYPKDIHFKDWDRIGFYAQLEEHGPHMHWETVNPEWWVPQGYVVIRIDARGTGKSKGRPTTLSKREAEDFYDAIEWGAEQAYCSGKVAVMGISYFAMNAWRVAALRPPHLAAIVPWEGALDLYRDANRHGGIASNTFTSRWSANVEKYAQAPQRSAAAAEHELIDERVLRNHPDVTQITAALFSAANWGGAGLHLRGNIEGYLAAGSSYKQLRIHVGNHCAPFYTLEGRLEQKRFLDHFLHGIDPASRASRRSSSRSGVAARATSGATSTNGRSLAPSGRRIFSMPANIGSHLCPLPLGCRKRLRSTTLAPKRRVTACASVRARSPNKPNSPGRSSSSSGLRARPATPT